MQFLHAVRADGDVVFFCERRDPKPSGDAKAVGGIGLDEAEAALGQRHFEFKDRVEVFTLGDLNAAFPRHMGVAGVVIGDNRLFKPEVVLVLDRAGQRNRFVARH